MAMVFTIAGVEKEVYPDWSVSLTINGRSTFNGRVRSIAGSYRPAIDDEILVVDDTDDSIIFGGLITHASEMGVIGGDVPIDTMITASDYSVLAELRHVTATVPTGNLKSFLTAILPYLQGVTLHGSQVNGPSIPKAIYDDVRADEVLNGLSLQASNYLWVISSTKVLQMFLPGTLAAPFNIIQGPDCLAEGDIRVQPRRSGYANRVIVRSGKLRAMAEDTAAQAAVGRIYEMLMTLPDSATQATLNQTATTALARALVVKKEVIYATREPGLLPGQTQTINASWRGLNNTFLITQINIYGRRYENEGIVYEISALEGTTYREGWREGWKQMGGSSLSVAVGGGVTNGLTRFAYPLGGTGVDAVVPADGLGGWVPAAGSDPRHGYGPFHVQIDTDARRTTAATVVGRLKADDSGVSVKARLYDVTAAAACAGESATVTNTEWETVVFGVTLTSGNHFYELQLWSNTAGAWVRAAGFYLE